MKRVVLALLLATSTATAGELPFGIDSAGDNITIVVVRRRIATPAAGTPSALG